MHQLIIFDRFCRKRLCNVWKFEKEPEQRLVFIVAHTQGDKKEVFAYTQVNFAQAATVGDNLQDLNTLDSVFLLVAPANRIVQVQNNVGWVTNNSAGECAVYEFPNF